MRQSRTPPDERRQLGGNVTSMTADERDDQVRAEVDWVDLGYVTKPHGLQGELRVFMFNADSTLFEGDAKGPPREIFLRTATGLRVKWSIAGFRRHKELYLLRLQGVTTRDEAEALRGQHLTLPREALPALEEDGEYYAVDLEKCQVVDETGTVVGRVVGVLNYPSVDCLAVELAPDQVEVPMVAPYLRGVDIERREIRVSGLSDLPRVKVAPAKAPPKKKQSADSALASSAGSPPSHANETEGA